MQRPLIHIQIVLQSEIAETSHVRKNPKCVLGFFLEIFSFFCAFSGTWGLSHKNRDFFRGGEGTYPEDASSIRIFPKYLKSVKKVQLPIDAF